MHTQLKTPKRKSDFKLIKTNVIINSSNKTQKKEVR